MLTLMKVSHTSWYVESTTFDTDMDMVKSVEDIPELKLVPDYLWAKSKHDVGLIKNCEHVIITPKSDYRPYRGQYHLRQEAVEGIKPVFYALSKAGVIVLCVDSPVSISSVKDST